MLKRTLLIGLLLSILSIFSTVLFTMPAFDSIFDLSSSKTANIGATISGITAPLIGLMTIYFLYVAFQKQAEANKIQLSRNDIDMAYRLLDDVNSELDRFVINETQSGKQTTFNGGIALYRYCKPFYTYPERYQFFKEQLETDIIIYIMHLFDLLIEAFEAALLPTNVPVHLFKAKLETPLKYLVQVQILEEDHLALYIREFYNKYSDAPITIDNLDTRFKIYGLD